MLFFDDFALVAFGIQSLFACIASTAGQVCPYNLTFFLLLCWAAGEEWYLNLKTHGLILSYLCETMMPSTPNHEYMTNLPGFILYNKNTHVTFAEWQISVSNGRKYIKQCICEIKVYLI